METLEVKPTVDWRRVLLLGLQELVTEKNGENAHL